MHLYMHVRLMLDDSVLPSTDDSTRLMLVFGWKLIIPVSGGHKTTHWYFVTTTIVVSPVH